MITLKSATSDGSSYQVYDDDKLIGHIIRKRGASGDRYWASLDGDGNGEHSEKEFHASHEALQWIESCWNGSL